MGASIAIVGMACRYPDARTPDELWENVLAERRAFRRIPPERLRLEDYFSTDRDAPDRIYVSEAALIKDYEFDRVGFRVSGETFRTADLAHWLALDVASQALSDAGFAEGGDLPREMTAVFLGNTLTGEFSRANVLRLRWPYVRRTVEGMLLSEGWSEAERAAFLGRLETAYKGPFPSLGEESLAGGLSNTIAGRICGHFLLQGGGYTIDGACASSLLAVANACSALSAGDVDVAVAGGVDISIDPFELVGFAKTGALASGEMRVYDARSDGFLPGEGCGFVVLMRQEDALACGRRVYASIRGWGVSSDGGGGITRPEVEGQVLALRRAYRRAGFGIETVGYFEGHGTGTSVGDATELRALTQERRLAAPAGAPAAIGSIKAIIGHTKAAAGVAGLIKAAMAVGQGILPPTTGCEEPHAELKSDCPALRVLREGELWNDARPRRAGVSAMGFGGINTHVTVESQDGERRPSFSARERALLSSYQDAELFLLGAQGTEELLRVASQLEAVCGPLSRAEMCDLAARLAHELDPAARVRAALVASTPATLTRCLKKLIELVEAGVPEHLDGESGVFFSGRRTKPRVGFLFPGQGSPTYFGGGAWARRFDTVRRLYDLISLPTGPDHTNTSIVQPAVVAASLAGLRMLKELDIKAGVAVGHSLGELTALHWSGALEEEVLLRLATVRGKITAGVNGVAGAMASIAAGRLAVEAILNGDRVVIAGVNSPAQTVISGERAAVETVVGKARARGLGAARLPVSHAFHSPLVESAAPALSIHLARETVRPPCGSVVSTVTGQLIKPESDLRAHLCRQITSPVLFMDAAAEADRSGVDLWLEVGPGRVLEGLTTQFLKTPVISLDSGGDSLKGLLLAAGAAFVLGASTNLGPLFAGRFTRPFRLDHRPSFFANPCERAPIHDGAAAQTPPEDSGRDTNTAGPAEREAERAAPAQVASNGSALELLVELVAARAELPPSAVKGSHRLLSDLHLNSITVTKLIAEASRRLGLPRPVAPTLYADATISEVADILTRQSDAGSHRQEANEKGPPAGIATWVRPFTIELVERPLPRPAPRETRGRWQVFAPCGHQFAENLRAALSCCEGAKGVAVCLPPRPDETHLGLLLQGAQAVLRETDGTRFLLVQHGGGAASFARTLRSELGVTTAVVDAPLDNPAAVDWVRAEALAAQDYSEAYYDADGRRREPVVRPLSIAEDSSGVTLTSDDTLVVTGGARGITAECALTLSKKTGARLALFGLSQPDSSAEIKTNLERLTAAGVRFRYYPVDITDEHAARAAVAQVEKELGTVTGIIHGAAKNEPLPLSRLDEGSFRKALDVKVRGARNLLASINPRKLRLLVTFGSIIARSGLPGEAHYGLANEWLARLTEEWRAAHPSCHALCVEWSLWALGMGVRLGLMDSLVRQGISPIPPEEGVDMLCRLVENRAASSPVVVMSRVPETQTFKLAKPELPLLRFLEQPAVYYPNTELVVDVELSTGTDPYLDDHKLKGERLLPAVIGLEAMAQAAAALVGSGRPHSFENINFNRPVIAPEAAPLRIRIAAQERGRGRVDVALRSEETDFQADHFSATCVFDDPEAEKGRQAQPPADAGEWKRLPINPERDLYDSTLFQRGRFRRLSGYCALSAKECLAEINSGGETPWFSVYLPQELLLGDPGARDTAMHAIQACIPHKRLLPVGVKRISIAETLSSEKAFVRARERFHEGNSYEYDLEVFGCDGGLKEHWEGLRLRAVEDLGLPDPLPIPLLGAYVERYVEEAIAGPPLSVAVCQGPGAERRTRADRAFQLALGGKAAVIRRADGKPEIAGAEGTKVSAAHACDLTLAVAGKGALGCDLEFVEDRRSDAWLDLLGEERLGLARVISDSFGEEIGASATRVWTASECLRKVGESVNAPLVLTSPAAESGWVKLSSGRLVIFTLVIRVRPSGNPLAIGVLIEPDARAEERKEALSLRASDRCED